MIKLNNKKGFTLIELMIVIAIIGILAAIAIPNFITYRNKAFCSKAESDAQSTQAAMSSYFSEPNNISLSDATMQLAANRPVMNPSNTFTITPVVATANSYKISVYDGTTRCPRGANKIYSTYFGTSEAGGWR